MPPSLASMIDFKPSIFYPYYNTRSPIDICVGQFNRGVNGEWLLDGGMGPVNGISARSGYFKSTTVDKIAIDLLEIYPDSEYFKMDTENTSTSKERFVSLANGRDIDIANRVHLTNKGELNLKEYCAMIQSIGEAKLKNKNDFLIETPFLNIETGKPLSILMPTFISLDSISNLSTDNNLEAIEAGIEDKRNNTADMHDGRIKKRLLDLFITWAYRYSFCFFVTAHIGEKQDIDPSRPTPKQNQWMSNLEKITNAGKNFLYLPNLSLQLTKLHPLVDDSKNPLYPSGIASTELEKVEINRLDVKVLRGKNNITGTIIPLVMSQHLGILQDLSFYEYLREIDGRVKSGEAGPSGFVVRGYNRYSPMLPDVAMNRKNIRQVCAENYKAKRALEIMFQFVWITRYWNLSKFPFNIPTTLEQFVNGINQSNNLAMNDILESRGYWTYNKKDDRQYLSIMDIFELIGSTDVKKTVQVPIDIEAAKEQQLQDMLDKASNEIAKADTKKSK